MLLVETRLEDGPGRAVLARSICFADEYCELREELGTSVFHAS